MTTKKFIMALVIVFLFVTGVGASQEFQVYLPLVLGESVSTATPTPTPKSGCPQDGWYLGSGVGITVEDCAITYITITFAPPACGLLSVTFNFMDNPFPIVDNKFDVTQELYMGTVNIEGEWTDKARGTYSLEKYDLYSCTRFRSWSATWNDPDFEPNPTPTPTVTPTPTPEPCAWNGEYLASDIGATVVDCIITTMWVQCTDTYNFENIPIIDDMFTGTGDGLTIYGTIFDAEIEVYSYDEPCPGGVWTGYRQ